MRFIYCNLKPKIAKARRKGDRETLGGEGGWGGGVTWPLLYMLLLHL